jgi:hypothetical protein
MFNSEGRRRFQSPSGDSKSGDEAALERFNDSGGVIS